MASFNNSQLKPVEAGHFKSVLTCEALPRPNRQDVYVSDEEYACVYYLANPYWKAMMEFA